MEKKQSKLEKINTAIDSIKQQINKAWHSTDASEAYDYAELALHNIVILKYEIEKFADFCEEAADTETPSFL